VTPRVRVRTGIYAADVVRIYGEWLVTLEVYTSRIGCVDVGVRDILPHSW